MTITTAEMARQVDSAYRVMGAGGEVTFEYLQTMTDLTDDQIRQGIAALAAPAVSLEDQIRAAYADLAAEPGAWVSLRRLRPEITATREDVDHTLRTMERREDVNLVPESNQKTLTDADRSAAVDIGDQDKHLIWIG